MGAIAYEQYLSSKIKLAQPAGFAYDEKHLPDWFKPHQKDVIKWAIKGGRRAIFASFGLGKTAMQLQIGDAVIAQTGKPFLIGMPLGVMLEFFNDAEKLGKKIRYVRNMEEVDAALSEGIFLMMSNYERIREGNFKPSVFGGVTFDEGAAIRNLDSITADVVIKEYSKIKYKFIATAVPSPNNYTELLNYAEFLGIMDRGQALTRFFQRNSTKAGDLTLYPHKKKEFWMWVRSWAVFLTTPSDLGYSDEGYKLPGLKINYHKVNVTDRSDTVDRDGVYKMFRDAAMNLVEGSKEKRESIGYRIEKMMEIITDDPTPHRIIWHDLEAERAAIEKVLPECKTVYGSQKWEDREDYLSGFATGRYKYMATKTEIAGAGSNFQRFCYKAIYLGINDKFHDFIQSIHRLLRFGQLHEVEIDIIYTDAEQQKLERLLAKWARHDEQMQEMRDLIKTYGLSDTGISDMRRSIGVERKEIAGNNFRAIRNDNTIELPTWPDNSVPCRISSWPFGDQYEYSESYHDYGHNFGNKEFFNQMDYLTPHIYRTHMPGRVVCVHVKDRIRYSYQNGLGFTSLEAFSDNVREHMEKHGFAFMGRITIPTDVVQENNQTYRLTHHEKCKDGTKMGVGLPEYVLLFRKPPTDKSNAYADIPVTYSKEDNPLSEWQIDAHAIWRTDGNRLLDPEELRSCSLKQMFARWKEYTLNNPYSYSRHVQFLRDLDNMGRLPKKFSIAPPYTINPYVWDDINRMNTLNTSQALRKQEKHLCPLQFDIINRLIKWFSNPGEEVVDDFGGVMSVPVCAIELGRKGTGIELNEQYWKDGVQYCREKEMKQAVPTLFDTI